MADYIDRQAALNVVENELSIDLSGDGTFRFTPCERNIALTTVANRLKELPSADVVEVVRCKDCIYWQDNNDGYPHEECRWGNDETPDPDDYCSYGERK